VGNEEEIMDQQRRATLAAATFGALALGATVLASPASAQEHHPMIRRAIDALEAAKNDLQHADHDFGGHRLAAIDAIDHALEQLRIAMRYDR
jgi:hypothetical protein